MAKKPKKEKKSKGRWELYDTSGGLKRKSKFCPKCGEGTFMAKHKSRYTCGKCGYMEKIESKPDEKPAEKKK
jgi:small subunit ribosomal protein S27Ae